MSNETSDDVTLHTDHQLPPSDPYEMLQRLANKIDKSADLTRTKGGTSQALYQAICYSGETNEMAGDGLGLSSARFISTNPDNGDTPIQLRQIKFQIIKGAGSREKAGWTSLFRSPDDQTLTPYEQNLYLNLQPWCYSVNEAVGKMPIKNGDIVNIKKIGGAYFYDSIAERSTLENLELWVNEYMYGSSTPTAKNAFSKPYSGGPDATIGFPTGDDKFSGAILPISMTVGRVTSRVGLRTHPVTGEKESSHGGIDIAAAIGTPLYAIYDGEVIKAKGTTINGKEVTGFGAWIIIKHLVKNNAGKDKTLYTIYGHINSAAVKQGDKVKQGQVVATVGNEGRSTGPHLHFELHTGWPKSNRTRLDPVDALGWPI